MNYPKSIQKKNKKNLTLFFKRYTTMKKYKYTGYFTQLEKIRKIKNKLYEIEQEARELEQQRLQSKA